MKKILYVLFLSLFLVLTSCTTSATTTDPDRLLQFADNKIHYQVHGDAEKTLVFIHGWTGSSQQWRFQVNAFPGYRTISIDLPGNGRSDKPQKIDYSPERFADAVHAVLQAEHIKKAFFIGHSMGFAICEIIEQKYPAYCIGICSMDGSHFEVPDDVDGKNAWIAYNRSFAASMQDEAGRNAFLSMLFATDTPSLLKDEVFTTSKLVPIDIARAMISDVEKSIQYFKPRISTIPCLAIHTPAYQLPPEYESQFKTSFPNSEFHMIEKTSHYVMMEQPFRINQLVFDFIKKWY